MVCFIFIPLDTCLTFILDRCQLSLSPMYGNMLGGTPITITIQKECANEITAPPMCVFDGKKMTKAVRDATSQTKYYCSTPAFDRDGRVTFEFRTFVENGGTRSLYDNFYFRKCRVYCVVHQYRTYHCTVFLISKMVL